MNPRYHKFAKRLGLDTVRKLRQAAIWRFADAECLLRANRDTAALYLFGYVAEAQMQAAYFALLRYKPNTEITTETRRAVLASARKLGLMSAAPHDLHGWARLLIQEHKTKGQPYQMAIANEVHDRAAVLYSLWRPSLRYRIVLPKTKEMEVAQDCAKWFNDHGAEL